MRSTVVVLTATLAALGLVGSGQIFGRAYLGMTHRGLVVASVEAGGPAALAGLRPGDRILTVDGVGSDRPTLCALKLRSARAGDVLALTFSRDDDREVRVVLAGARPPRSELIWRFSMAAAGFFALALGFFLAYQLPERLTLVFFGICFSIAFFLREHPELESEYWLYAHESFYTLVQFALPALFVHFFLLFPERSAGTLRPGLERLVYGPAVILTLSWQILNLTAAGGRDTVRLESLHLLLSTIYFVAYATLAIGIFVRSFRRTTAPLVRARFRAAVWGTVLGLAPMLVATVLVNLQPERDIPGIRYAALAFTLIPASFAYAAFRHRVFDVEILVKRSVLYSTLTALLLVVYFAVVAGVGNLLHRVTGARNPLLVLVSIFAMALIAAPARSRLQGFVDRVFFRDRYDAREALRRFSRDLTHMIELGGIASLLVQRVTDLLDVESAALLLRSTRGEPFRLQSSVPARAEPGPALSAGASESLGDQAHPMRVDETRDGGWIDELLLDDRRALLAYRPAIVVPIRARELLLGLLILGPRRGLGWTSQADLDLLETLGQQAAIAIENAMLHRQALEKERVEQELVVARGIQAQLVPARDPLVDSVEFASSTVACHEIGGDFYDFVPLGRDRLGIAIGDVSGKGIPAALLMAGLQSSFRTEAERGQEPHHVLSSLNHRIASLGESARFVCFFYGVLDLVHRQMTYANAGLDPPILVRAGGRVERLLLGGPILGVLPAPHYPEGKVSLAEGDTLILYTDGLVEPVEKRTGLGEQDLIRELVQFRAASAREIKDRMVHRLHNLVGEAPDDDTTLIVARAV